MPFLHSQYSDVLFWLAAAVAAIAQLAVVRAAFVGRTPGTSTSTVTRVRELVWVLIPAALLLTVLVWTWTNLPPDNLTPTSGLGNIGLASPRATPVGS